MSRSRDQRVARSSSTCVPKPVGRAIFGTALSRFSLSGANTRLANDTRRMCSRPQVCSCVLLLTVPSEAVGVRRGEITARQCSSRVEVAYRFCYRYLSIFPCVWRGGMDAIWEGEHMDLARRPSKWIGYTSSGLSASSVSTQSWSKMLKLNTCSAYPVGRTRYSAMSDPRATRSPPNRHIRNKSRTGHIPRRAPATTSLGARSITDSFKLKLHPRTPTSFLRHARPVRETRS